jgi:hypothetical protein
MLLAKPGYLDRAQTQRGFFFLFIVTAASVAAVRMVFIARILARYGFVAGNASRFTLTPPFTNKEFRHVFRH